VRAHLGLPLHRDDVPAQEVDDEHEGEEVEGGQGGDVLPHELPLVGHALVVEEPVEEREGDDGLLEVGEELLDEAGDEVRVGDLLQVAEVASAQLLQGLVLLVDGDALPEDALLQQRLRLLLEVPHQQLQHHGDAQFSQLIILQLVDLLGDERLHRALEIVFLLDLLLAQVLSLHVDAVGQQGGSALEVARELLADLLGYERHEVMHLVVLPLHQLLAVLQRLVGLRKDLVRMAQHVEGADVEVGLHEVETAHLLDHPQRQQVEGVLELEVVVGGRSVVVEVDEGKRHARSAYMMTYSGWKFLTRYSSSSFSARLGAGWR
jgi:hypothetical protein